MGIGCLLLILTLGATGARGAVRLVRPDGTGDVPTIQAALDASASGDTVLLADGTFTGAGNRDLNFRGRAVLLASQSQSADACILDVQASPNNLHRGILCSSGEGPGTVVEDLTITHGHAQVGAAVLMLATSPRFRRVVFAENSTSAAGAVYALNGSPDFEDCVFRDNVTPLGSGGAFYCKFGGTPRFTGCKFFDNQARFGGAAYCRENASPAFEHCVWVGNHAYSGGALMGADGTHPVLTDNTFDGNRGGIGGAIHLGEAADAELTRCELSRNEASRGAGLSCRNAVPLVAECLFTENRARLFGGGVYADSGAVMRLTRCTLVTNDAAWDAGAVGVLDGRVEFDHCTLSGNAAIDSLAGGVSARGALSEVVLRGTIVAFSRAGCAVGCDAEALVRVEGCDLFGNAGGDYVGCLAGMLGTASNIAADPLFCHQGGREFMLDARSPCATRVEIEFGVIGAWGVGCEREDGRAEVAQNPDGVSFRLGPGHPNPFRAATVIPYALPDRVPDDATLEILDCAGRCVRTLRCARQAGSGQVAWDGRDASGAPVAAGVYQARLRAGAWVASRPLLRIR
jgi:predicted outer membrane repeat protein